MNHDNTSANEPQKITPLTNHWADVCAAQILRERANKSRYVCASGITPSGVVHIGNIREIISVELVVRALRDRGANAHFIYSWDDYDVFRKVPAKLAQAELLQTFLRQPLTRVPDTNGKQASYAAANEKQVEEILPRIGIEPHYLYQAERYQRGDYCEQLRFALQHRDAIAAILDQFRLEPLSADWWPMALFCPQCHCDTTKIESWDGDYTVTYSCSTCQQQQQALNFKEQAVAKLPWRIDWPMRWCYEQVDFEPAGKEHHSAGGSFSTAALISEQVFNYPPPVTFKYDFIRLKGMDGKMSSSTGDVVSLNEVLQVYQAEIVRYLFVSTRPNSEFAISFDLDVIKIYEDYDRCVQAYYQNTPVTDKAKRKQEKQRRIFELSQVNAIPATRPYLLALRHLCNLLQIHDGNITATLQRFPDISVEQLAWVEARCRCAWFWLQNFAPEEFCFQLGQKANTSLQFSDNERQLLALLSTLIKEKLDQLDEQQFGQHLYALLEQHQCQASDFFPLVYQCLIGKEQGPRLLPFLYAIGAQRSAQLLDMVN